MTIYIGADHGGFDLKEQLKGVLQSEGYDLVDVGAAEKTDGDDYPDFAKLVAEKVGADRQDVGRGILICRSGFGMDIAANKFDGVRAALPSSPDHMYQGRHDDDVNVLCLAADFTDFLMAQKIMKVFFSTPFAKEERYARRLRKIEEIEAGN